MIIPPINESVQVILDWIIDNSSLILVVGMIFEGPTIILVASFGATMGYIGLPTIFILGILGDILGDLIWYGVGYLSRESFIETYGKYIGLSQERLEKLYVLFKRHPGKMLLALKISPILAVPGIIASGITKMPVKKFLTTIISIIIPKVIFFMIVGYSFGHFYESVAKTLRSGFYAFGITIISVIAISYLYRKESKKISERIAQEKLDV